MLAKLHAALGEHEYAVEHARAYLAEHPEDTRTRVLAAQSLLRIGRRDEAMAELDRVPPDQRNAEVLYARARLYLGMGKAEPARELMLQAAQTAPHHPEILGTLLSIDRGTPRLAETKAMIEQAVAARPDDAELARLRGALAIVERDAETAEKSLERAIELKPEDPTINDHLGDAYWRVGREREAHFQWAHARDLKPEPEDLIKIEAKLKSGLPDETSSEAKAGEKPEKKGGNGG